MFKKIRIHPLTLPFFILFLFYDRENIYLTLYLLILLHELSHALLCILLKEKISAIHLYPWGCMLSLSSIPDKKRHLLILIAGPSFNLLMHFLNIFPSENLSLALFNLIPVIPLDGGVIVNTLFPKFSFLISLLSIVFLLITSLYLNQSILLPLCLTLLLFFNEKNRLDKNIYAKVIEKSKEKLYNTIDKI